jgi:hypothetical protein
VPTRRWSENVLAVDIHFPEADWGGDSGNEKPRRPGQLCQGSAGLVASPIRRWDIPRRASTLAVILLEHKQSIPEARMKTFVVMSLVTV